MEGEFERVIFLFAFVLIALVRWVLARMAEKRAEREGRSLGDEEEQEVWEPPGTKREGAPTTPTARGGGEDLNPELRRLLEAIGVETEPPPEPKPATPPPIPPPIPQEHRTIPQPRTKTPERAVPTLSKAERDALDAIKKRGFQTLHRKKHRGHTATTTIRGMLAAPGSIKQAFVLKEILDSPVGIRERANAPLSS